MPNNSSYLGEAENGVGMNRCVSEGKKCEAL